MSKHTPGPWTADIGTKGAHINVANDHNHPLSFAFWYSEIDAPQQAEGRANARLIAAAPELLAALRWALHHAEHCMVLADRNDPERTDLDRARAALARAEGR